MLRSFCSAYKEQRATSNPGAVVRGISGRAPDHGGNTRRVGPGDQDGGARHVLLQADSRRLTDLPVSAAGSSPSQYSDNVLEALATAIVLVDGAECVTYLNTAAQGLLGVSERRAIGQPLPELVPGLCSAPHALRPQSLRPQPMHQRQRRASVAPDRGLHPW